MNKKLVIFGIGESVELAYFYFTNDSDFEVFGFNLVRTLIKDNKFKGPPVVDYQNKYSFFL